MAGMGGRKRTTWTRATAPRGRGRPRGAKDVVPRGFKASIKALYEIAVQNHPDAILKAVVMQLKRGSAKHLEQAADYLDGKPVQRVSLETPQPITFILRPPPPERELPP